MKHKSEESQGIEICAKIKYTRMFDIPNTKFKELNPKKTKGVQKICQEFLKRVLTPESKFFLSPLMKRYNVDHGIPAEFFIMYAPPFSGALTSSSSQQLKQLMILYVEFSLFHVRINTSVTHSKHRYKEMTR